MMRAAVLIRPGFIETKDVPLPVMDENSLLIEVKVVGLCGSDKRIFEVGSPRLVYPAIIGHEISGLVVQVGKKVKGWKEGDRVSLGSGIPCGNCSFCKSEASNLCENDLMFGFQIPGGLAQFMRIPPEALKRGSVQKIPPELDFEMGALAEPLASILHAWDMIKLTKNDSALVIGAGPAGVMAALVARALKCSDVTLLCKSETPVLSEIKRDGVRILEQESSSNLMIENLKVNGGKGFSAVLVAAGSVGAQQTALNLTRKRGRISFFGVVPKGTGILSLNSNDVHYKELTISGAHGATPFHHRLALSWLRKLKKPMKKLITHRYTLDTLPEAFERMKGHHRIKLVVLPQLIQQ